MCLGSFLKKKLALPLPVKICAHDFNTKELMFLGLGNKRSWDPKELGGGVLIVNS